MSVGVEPNGMRVQTTKQTNKSYKQTETTKFGVATVTNSQSFNTFTPHIDFLNPRRGERSPKYVPSLIPALELWLRVYTHLLTKSDS
jgi:hypothetical protein